MMDIVSNGEPRNNTPPVRGVSTRRASVSGTSGILRARVTARLAALLLLTATVLPGCGSDRPSGGEDAARTAPPGGPDPAEPSVAGSVHAEGTPAADSIEAEVLSALEASRDALRRLDVEAFLGAYETGPELLVVDPAGEFEGRDAFERHVRAWFGEALRRGPVYAVVTARERVHPLGAGLATAVFHWSAPGADGPYRTLAVLRRGPHGWRIAAEHSAPVPDEAPEPEAREASPPPPRR
ncbi:MAG TPA: nuclear transport factor 2 family protein [Gemmatimonadota bacterium]|jgi:ketosteroid isomerase-like protein